MKTTTTHLSLWCQCWWWTWTLRSICLKQSSTNLFQKVPRHCSTNLVAIEIWPKDATPTYTKAVNENPIAHELEIPALAFGWRCLAKCWTMEECKLNVACSCLAVVPIQRSVSSSGIPVQSAAPESFIVILISPRSSVISVCTLASSSWQSTCDTCVKKKTKKVVNDQHALGHAYSSTWQLNYLI
jgi:hypothetical protein